MIAGRMPISPVPFAAAGPAPSRRIAWPSNARPDWGKSTTWPAPPQRAEPGAASGCQRQPQSHAEATDLGPAKFQATAIGVRQVGDDGMAEARTRLGFIQAASADDG